jgi:WhiB family redox-sensing transcriptional regulator
MGCRPVPRLSPVKGLSLTWQQTGACREGDAGVDFYPPMHTERKHERLARERRAKSVCATCPVRTECLEHAVQVDERYGIWGGLNQDERRLLRASA